MGNIIDFPRIPASASPFASMQSKFSRPLPQETARVPGSFSTACTPRVQALSSKFAGKTQVGEPKPGAPAPSVDTQGAPGSGLLAFYVLATIIASIGTSWAVLGW